MNWSKLFRRSPPPSPITWGIKPITKRPKGEVFHAEGRVKNASGYFCLLVCKIHSAKIELSPTDHEINQSCLEYILREERRERLRGAAAIVFTRKPNFWLDFTATPNVGEARSLIRCGVYLQYQAYDSIGLAQVVCSFLARLPDDPQLPVRFLIEESWATTHFWHCAVLTGYCRTVLGGDR